MNKSIYQSPDLIPHYTSGLPPGPWLVFAPHADDEALGMGGALLLGRKQEIEIDLVVLTDGAYWQQPGEPSIRDIREKEALTLAADLNLRRIEFWRQPDGRLAASKVLVDRVAEVVSDWRPLTVFIPSPFELNADHRTAAALVWQGLQQAAYNGSVYVYEITVAMVCNCLIDITMVAADKDRLLECYPSQAGLNNYLAVCHALDTARTFTLPLDVQRAEAFFVYSDGASGSLLAPLAAHLHGYWAGIGPRPGPLVSVIVRTKDRPHLLQEALQSIVLQTYAPLELVVVNDGGCDVGDLVQGYAQRILQVQYLNLPTSHGRAGAANAGLDAASGDYIIFLDDDDLFEADHIAGLMTLLQAQPEFDLAYSSIRQEEAAGQSILNWAYNPQWLRTLNLFTINAALFSRRLLEKGCRFDEAFSIYEDWDFWLQAAEHTDFVHLDRASAVYRVTLGDSRCGGNDFDEDKTQKARQQLVAKWAEHWDHEELLDQVSFLRNHCVDLVQWFQSLLREEQQKTQSLLRVEQQKTQSLLWEEQQKTQALLREEQTRRQALENELNALKLSFSYGVGQWLTAPWRWLKR